jgi:hypothetical protein
MSVQVGDVVTLAVEKVAGYACWGSVGSQTGFVHCVDWSFEKPVPESKTPKVGDQLKVKVFRLVREPQAELPADVTFGGTITVHFAGSAALLEKEHENNKG